MRCELRNNPVTNCCWGASAAARPRWIGASHAPGAHRARTGGTGHNGGVTPRPPSRTELAGIIDHTLLKPEATARDVDALCEEAVVLGVFAVCVSPTFVPAAVRRLGGRIAVATVCGFPSGAHTSGTKAFEAGSAASAGADEIDMVVNLGLVKESRFSSVEREVRDVVKAAEGASVKVIIESAALTDDEIVAACLASVAGGARLVKTSTGYHASGGAGVDAVRLMRVTVGPGIGVKASGGIRTAEQAVAMVRAGASRIGCSASASILRGLPQ